MTTERSKNTLPDNAVVALLNQLLAVNWDSREGYQTAAQAAVEPDYQAIFQEYATQRTQQIEQLSSMIHTYGGEPVGGGNIVGVLRRAWMDLEAAVTAGDNALLAACDHNEEGVLTLYMDALAQVLPADVAALVREHITDIRNAHERVHLLNVALK